MTDRVKYFLLGMLFLVVAGVIAFDRLNSRDAMNGGEETAREDENTGSSWINPNGRRPGGLVIDDRRGRDPEPEPAEVPPIPSRKPPVDPEPEPEPAPAPRPASAKTHVVKSGETLESISKLYYSRRWYKGIKLITEASAIDNPNRISIGQKLVIPAMSTSASPTPTVSPGAVRQGARDLHGPFVGRRSLFDLPPLLRRGQPRQAREGDHATERAVELERRGGDDDQAAAEIAAARCWLLAGIGAVERLHHPSGPCHVGGAESHAHRYHAVVVVAAQHGAAIGQPRE